MEVDVNENYVLGDVIHHNSGKSLCCSVEVARCALGRDPHEKYRQPNKRSPLIIFTVAYDAKSIGRRLYRYLFRWGAFDIVRDEKTNRWRVFIPGQDKESERMPAPPLIPQEEIAEIAWTQKRNREFNCVTLKNGTEIYAFPSKGDPPQGDQVDLYWIDEDIEDDEWVDEAHQRLSKRRGKFIWSALPKSKNTGLLDMLEMAKTQEGRESPDCVSWQLSLLDNPYIHADEKRKRVEEAEARGEDIVRLRIYGDPMSQSWLVYPQFSRAVHGITRDDLPGRAIPAEWTRYLITDPGRSRCGSLLAAVPPPHSEFVEKHGDTIVIYAEAVIEQCNSKKYAEALKRKMLDDEFYEWVMDDHFGRLSDHTAAGKKVKEYYAEELAQLGCTSIAHGPNFIPACDNINARVEAVCTALTVRRNGTPRLRVLADELPLFMLEISRYRNKLERIKGMMRPTDKPDKRKGFELMDCLEYACAHEMAYVEYDYKRARVIPWAVLRKKAKDAKKKESQTTSFVLG